MRGQRYGEDETAALGVCVCDEVHLLVVVLVWMIPSVNTHVYIHKMMRKREVEHVEVNFLCTCDTHGYDMTERRKPRNHRAVNRHCLKEASAQSPLLSHVFTTTRLIHICGVRLHVLQCVEHSSSRNVCNHLLLMKRIEKTNTAGHLVSALCLA